MTWELIVGPEAEAEIAAAQDWYEERIPGLGAEFIAAAKRGNRGKPFSTSNNLEELSPRSAPPISVSCDLCRIRRGHQGGSLHSRPASS